jgi:hypothetical protein
MPLRIALGLACGNSNAPVRKHAPKKNGHFICDHLVEVKRSPPPKISPDSPPVVDQDRQYPDLQRTRIAGTNHVDAS